MGKAVDGQTVAGAPAALEHNTTISPAAPREPLLLLNPLLRTLAGPFDESVPWARVHAVRNFRLRRSRAAKTGRSHQRSEYHAFPSYNAISKAN